MNFYSRTKPSLVNNMDNNIENANVSNNPPVNDIVTSGLIYIYNYFIKDNIIWIVIALLIALILYFRLNKQKNSKEEFNEIDQHLVTFNPTQRSFNGDVVSLPNDIESPPPESFPAMNHTPYNPERAYIQADQRTGTIDNYSYYPDSNINNYMGYSPDYLSTTSNFAQFYTDKGKQSVLDLRRLIDDRNKQLENNLHIGPSSLSKVTEFEPPYATDL